MLPAPHLSDSAMGIAKDSPCFLFPAVQVELTKMALDPANNVPSSPDTGAEAGVPLQKRQLFGSPGRLS